MTTHSPRPSPAVRAGIYTRISYDPAGQRAGVGGKLRRAYQQLLRSVEAGEIDAVVTWQNDRLHRSPKSWRASSTSSSAPASEWRW